MQIAIYYKTHLTLYYVVLKSPTLKINKDNFKTHRLLSRDKGTFD